MTTPRTGRRFINPLLPRDPTEAHRVASPLELFTDLCFVVAISQAASSFHLHLSEGHGAKGLVGFAMVFFAIFWAWLNFSWFASAYDNDDVGYRLLTLLHVLGLARTRRRNTRHDRRRLRAWCVGLPHHAVVAGGAVVARRGRRSTAS